MATLSSILPPVNLSMASGTLPVGNGGTGVTTSTGSGSVVLSTTPTFTTSLISPIVVGGTAVSSALTLRSTSALGTSDAIIFQTASQTEVGRFTNSGYLEAVYSDEVVALGNSGTATTINLNQGSNGAARVGDTADTQDPGNAVGTNKIESGSSTVFIGG